jgi:hypothetical protein
MLKKVNERAGRLSSSKTFSNVPVVMGRQSGCEAWPKLEDRSSPCIGETAVPERAR